MRIHTDTVKIDLRQAKFKSEEDRKNFLLALEKSHFKWLHDEAENIEKGNEEVQYEPLAIDLNDPPFAKNVHFMENAEKLCEALAAATDVVIRRAVVHSMYANSKALSKMLEDSDEGVREVAKRRLSGTANEWSVKIEKAVEILPLFYWQKQFLNV